MGRVHSLEGAAAAESGRPAGIPAATTPFPPPHTPGGYLLKAKMVGAIFIGTAAGLCWRSEAPRRQNQPGTPGLTAASLAATLHCTNFL